MEDGDRGQGGRGFRILDLTGGGRRGPGPDGAAEDEVRRGRGFWNPWVSPEERSKKV